jgi:ribonuclease HII
MPYLIGTDEAGYAPNLGPLVVSASVWHVNDSESEEDLYKRLKDVICKSSPRSGAFGRLAIADSKLLYTPASGLRSLERGVLAALALVNHCPADWLEVWQLLDPASLAYLPALPWHVDYDLRLPLAAQADDIVRLVPKLRGAFDRSGVRLVALKSRAIFPDQFNQSTLRYGTKSETLSKVTLALLAESLDLCVGEPVLAVCDKHGARNQYGRLLQQQFPDVLVEVHGEAASESIYRWGPTETRIDVRFRPGAETFLPAALASMASKYLRELAMRAFNDFWCRRVRDLAPTAGYPQDARRFMAAIEGVQAELGIAKAVMWRDR